MREVKGAKEELAYFLTQTFEQLLCSSSVVDIVVGHMISHCSMLSWCRADEHVIGP